MPETTQQKSHFAIVTAQTMTPSGPVLSTWTTGLTLPSTYTREQAFQAVMGEFVRTHPIMADHVILLFDLQRNEV
ncbi:hypothetical protein ADK55_18645 [Streptomyces sp. WM4235]|uniref:hypothetical protein n=1 Tax=Streptomyces sp. WM4235 TaxID=1415551 RepID=UPI0006ADB58D|nr:hypothetical protein [Streptomyces sp. WM4235]KOU50562.1 hypothetical protein ADK55_18645 [Streptomyces sp. WM4235]